MNCAQGPAGPCLGAVVVGLDAHDRWERTLDWAVDQAVLEQRPLTIVHAAEAAEELWHDPQGRDTRVGVVQDASPGHLLVDHARARALARAPELTVHELLQRGAPRAVLTAAAADAHLLVIGARDHRGPWVRVFGSTGTAISRRPPCAVAVVRADHPGRVHTGVLVGVDDTAYSQSAVRFAFTQASLHRWPLTVLHVAPEIILDDRRDERERERLHVATAISGESERFPDVPVRSLVEYGEPAACLLRAGSASNLIVVGAHHGGRASDVFLGSVVVPLVERARCSVAIVPHPAP